MDHFTFSDFINGLLVFALNETVIFDIVTCELNMCSSFQCSLNLVLTLEGYLLIHIHGTNDPTLLSEGTSL